MWQWMDIAVKQLCSWGKKLKQKHSMKLITDETHVAMYTSICDLQWSRTRNSEVSVRSKCLETESHREENWSSSVAGAWRMSLFLLATTRSVDSCPSSSVTWKQSVRAHGYIQLITFPLIVGISWDRGSKHFSLIWFSCPLSMLRIELEMKKLKIDSTFEQKLTWHQQCIHCVHFEVDDCFPSRCLAFCSLLCLFPIDNYHCHRVFESHWRLEFNSAPRYS